MPGDTVVMVRAGKAVFAVVTSFARLPAPGEHVILALGDAQREQLSPEFGYGTREYVPAIVRQTVLRQKDQWRKNLPNPWARSAGIEVHAADVFAEAVTTDAWNAMIAGWAAGDEKQ